jgi:hypothetical protein
MFLDDVPVNYPTVLLAAIVYFVIGAIWYSPFLFGHYKSHEHGTPAQENVISTPLDTKQRHWLRLIGPYIGEFIISLIIAYVLTLFIQISQAEEIAEGIAVALWIWIGFIATTHFSAVLWDRKTVHNFFIHAGFMLVGLMAMGATIIYFEP